MAKGIYPGVVGSARKVKKLFVGINGAARKVKKVYVGVGGVARLSWTSAEDGQQVFTASGTFTVPDGITKVDIFCVGGGQTGGLATASNDRKYVYDDNGVGYRREWARYGGNGGNGGQTITKQSVSVVEGATYSVLVGASDGNTTVGNLCTALAGAVGRGSGGGRGTMSYDDSDADTYYYHAGSGGSDGVKGGNTTPYRQYTSGILAFYGQAGQGTTTRAFGEASGTLYAGGGGGGKAIWQYVNQGVGGTPGGGSGAGWGAVGVAATPNTGSGGGGGSLGGGMGHDTNPPQLAPGAGGSGMVIIRWYAEQQ